MSFLTNRSQKVVVDGVSSKAVSVDSGVPQGIILFLCHINDIPTRVSSQVRMFADDCLLYEQIRSEDDHSQVQQDIKNLEEGLKCEAWISIQHSAIS